MSIMFQLGKIGPAGASIEELRSRFKDAQILGCLEGVIKSLEEQGLVLGNMSPENRVYHFLQKKYPNEKWFGEDGVSCRCGGCCSGYDGR